MTANLEHLNSSKSQIIERLILLGFNEVCRNGRQILLRRKDIPAQLVFDWFTDRAVLYSGEIMGLQTCVLSNWRADVIALQEGQGRELLETILTVHLEWHPYKAIMKSVEELKGFHLMIDAADQGVMGE